MKNPIILTILLVCSLLFFSSLASAFEFDNIKTFDKKSEDKYGQIIIRNGFGVLGKLAEVKLLNNSDVCLNDCFAEGTIRLYSDSKLFDKLDFKGVGGINKEVKNSKIYLIEYKNITVNIPHYEKVCTLNVKNNSQICNYINNYNESRVEVEKRLIEYRGEILSPGNYNWRIEATKSINDNIDWLGNIFGKQLSEWAWWNNSMPYSRSLNFTTGDAIDVNYTHRVRIDYQSEFGATCNQVALVWQDAWERDLDVRICNSSTMEIGFRNNVSIGAGVFDNNYSLYYGAAITRKSDNNLVYTWNDDFTGVAVNTSKYDVVGTPNCASVSGGICTMGSASGGQRGGLVGNINFSSPATFEINATYFVTNQQYGGFIPSLNIPDGATPFQVAGGNANMRLSVNGANNGTNVFNSEAYHYYSVFRNGSTDVRGYQDNSSAFAPPTNILSYSTTNSLRVGFNFADSSGHLVDYMRAFTDVSNRPTYTIGAQSSSPNVQAPTVNLISPTNGFSSANSSLTLKSNASIGTGTGNLSNATYFVWNSSHFVYNRTTLVITGDFNQTEYNITGLIAGTYNWNVLACATNSSTTVCGFANSNFSLSIGTEVNSNSFNTSTYQTAFETIMTNVTLSPGANLTNATLYWNATRYQGSFSNSMGNTIVNTTLAIPSTAIGNVSWNWALSFSNLGQINVTTQYQNVSPINFTTCGASPQNVPYLNFTFLDEVSGAAINGSVDSFVADYYLGVQTTNKTYSYSNSTTAASQAFCFTPPFRIVNASVRYQYSGTGYPSRTFIQNFALTNVTTNQTLYLLSSSDGIYSTYAITNTAGNPIQGANVVVERQFNGVWTIVGQTQTDSFGAATFWLNPNFQHRVTVTATGYLSNQVLVFPSQSLYTIQLTTTSGGATYSSNVTGINYVFYPKDKVLNPNSTYIFGLTVNASQNNLVGCKVELFNSTTSLANATGCSSSGGRAQITFNTSSYDQIIMYLYLDVGDGYFIVDPVSYFVDYTNVSSFTTLKSFFENLAQLDDAFGDSEGRNNFSKTVFFFLLISMLTAFLTIYTGIEIINPGYMIPIMAFFLYLGAAGGLFIVDLGPSNTFVNTSLERVFIPLLFTIFMIGYYLNQLRRQTQ